VNIFRHNVVLRIFTAEASTLSLERDCSLACIPMDLNTTVTMHIDIGRAKETGLFLRVGDIATFRDRKACDMSKVIKVRLEKIIKLGCQ